MLVKDWFDFASDDGGHYTNILIQDLKEGVAATLADPQQRRQWGQQVRPWLESNTILHLKCIAVGLLESVASSFLSAVVNSRRGPG